MMRGNKKEIRDAVVAASRLSAGRRRLPCAAAFALKEKHGISLKEICGICDKEGIKIVKCQLGCFR